ncbi:MAG: TonB-dependent receptor [Bacteroidia bacterium]|nr:TonB-dependent receptor [Bacteroidia bacterium]
MKKKLINLKGKSYEDFAQILRTMKLITLLIFTAFFQLSATTYSQSTRLNISGQNITLSEIFEGIEKQSEFSIFYNVNQIDLTKRIDINAADQLVEQILNEILVGTGMTYTINNKLIVIHKQNDASLVLIDQQQGKKVTGKVTDQSGTVLPGVTIVVKGTINGTITDSNGNYTLSNVPENATMQFSFVGMKTQEILVSGKSTINVTILEETIGLDEVVAVGYGTQRKMNLTGSVSAVSSESLASRPQTNASNLLQGRVAGLNVTQPTGQPGVDDGIYQIRGLGSFGASSDPLILVDGVVGTLSNVAPNDIGNITVLKDAASASIYGARAANGVILVTTKKAAKGTSIEYKLDVGSQSATRLPDLIYNTAEYMGMYNSARQRSGLAPLFSQAIIDSYANSNGNPEYPNFNWMDYYFNPASTVNHYLSISNTSDKSSFKLSLNYLNEDGIVPNINFKRYNAQLNFNNQITKGIKIGTIIGAVYKDNHQPPAWEESSVLTIIRMAPDYSPLLPDGSGRKSSIAYPFEPSYGSDVYFNNGALYTKTYGLNAQAYVDVNLLKGLVWSSKAAVNYSDITSKNWGFQSHEHYYFHKLPGQTDYTLNPGDTYTAGVKDQYTVSVTPTLYSTLTYETKIGLDHNFKAMLGYEQQSNKTVWLGGSKNVFPVPSLQELDAGGSTGQAVNGSAYEWALRSYFGRIAYDYKGKYLVEVNTRYDGTSRVSPKKRWGLFPSVSLGWRISDEKFMKDKISWLDNLKFRASVGVLGNQEIGNYSYQDILNLSQYNFGTTNIPGVKLTRLTDQNLKWESTKVIDFGVDIDISKRLLGITFDMFRKDTYDILATLPVPSSLGLIGPITNNGELQNTGWEMELRHAKKIGDFSYDVNFLFSTYKNKLLSIVTPTKGINEVGLAYSSFYLYEMAGIFQSQADIDASPKQALYKPHPGDIKIKDVNGDGVIDSKDRKSFSPYPDFTYSFGLNARYKAFELSVFLQGVQGIHKRIYGWGWDPFVQGDPPLAMYRNAWTPTNPSNTIPAVYIGSGDAGGGYGGVKAYPNTFQLQDASFLRVKSVKLSYTLPQRIVDKIKSKGINVYVNGDNLFTFTKYPGTDPERRMDGPNGGRGFYYPQVRTLNAGIDIKF